MIGLVKTSLSPAESENKTVPHTSHGYTSQKGINGANPNNANPAIVKNGIERIKGPVFILFEISDIKRSTQS